jgi:hypothetical protein
MIDLLILGKLVDRLIDLVKRREEMNRVLFVNLGQTAFQAFEAVHVEDRRRRSRRRRQIGKSYSDVLAGVLRLRALPSGPTAQPMKNRT